jgi:hypothetical protein
MYGPGMADTAQPGITPAAPAAAEAADTPSRGFSQWMESQQSAPVQPAAPAAATPQEQLPEIDSETAAHLDAYDRRLRGDLDTRLGNMASTQHEDSLRTEMWNGFQSRYPEFRGQDDFIASSFGAITQGTMAVPPTVDLRDELLSRVYDHAVKQRDRMLEAGGYELVAEEDEEDVNRTQVEGGNQHKLPPEEPSAPEEEDESTLSSTLVMMQGETDFYPEMNEADVLASYGKRSSAS